MHDPQVATKRVVTLAVVLAGYLVSVSLGATLAWSLPETRSDDHATPLATPSPCPVTTSNGKQPPPGENVFGRGPGGHGSGQIWTNLWTWGEGIILVPPTHVQPDGTLGGMKWPWWRGRPGSLSIEGHRLDAVAPPCEPTFPAAMAMPAYSLRHSSSPPLAAGRSPGGWGQPV